MAEAPGVSSSGGKMRVELVTPEAILFSGEADFVKARAGGGDIAFLPGHAPFIGTLAPGPVVIRNGSVEEHAAVHSGFVEVSGNTVTILSDVAELASQIDLHRAQQLKEWAEEKLRHDHDGEAEAALRRAHVRIELAGGVGTRTDGH